MSVYGVGTSNMYNLTELMTICDGDTVLVKSMRYSIRLLFAWYIATSIVESITGVIVTLHEPLRMTWREALVMVLRMFLLVEVVRIMCGYERLIALV